MSWLAKITPTRENLVQNRLFDTYAWHQAVWKCFPHAKNRDFLTRILADGSCFVLSRIQPSRPDWCPESGWKAKEIASTFLDHTVYRFDLFANPTIRLLHDAQGHNYERGKEPRVPLIHVPLQQAWLERKGKAHGFCIQSLDIDPARKLYFRRKGKQGLHVGVRFRGVLQVTDKQLFEKAFYTGIGGAKAFGFGMLLLQPLH